MTRRLIIVPLAAAEIVEAGDWYNERSPSLGNSFVHAVDLALAKIQQNPFQYQIVWRQFRRAGVARFPYGLIYSISDADITVLSCFHGKRNPNA